jgi:hypothetical protein
MSIKAMSVKFLAHRNNKLALMGFEPLLPMINHSAAPPLIKVLICNINISLLVLKVQEIYF